MQQYQFQYTSVVNRLLVLLFCFIIIVLVILIGVFAEFQESTIMLITIIVIIPSFIFFKRIAVSDCTAIINDNSVEFHFNDASRSIRFDDLTSFKASFYTHGLVLYLDNTTDHFKIAANTIFCNTEKFRLFCEDLVRTIDKYKSVNHSAIVHEGSVFATKGMVYFLCIATSIYLLAFFIESRQASLYIGIGGGLYLLILWIGYFNKRHLKSK